MRAHHLVPAEVWGIRADIAALAVKAGWSPDIKANLIALPADLADFNALGWQLPMHSRNHPIYNVDTLARIDVERSKFPAQLTPEQAREILDKVAKENLILIKTYQYHIMLKVAE